MAIVRKFESLVKYRKNHTRYKAAHGVAVGTVEAEIDFGETYNEITILNTGDNDIYFKFNDPLNDEILLTKDSTADSSISIEFEVGKIYYKTSSGTSTMRYMVTK